MFQRDRNLFESNFGIHLDKNDAVATSAGNSPKRCQRLTHGDWPGSTPFRRSPLALAVAANLGSGGVVAIGTAAVSQPTIHEQARMPEPVGPEYAAVPANPARSNKWRNCPVQLGYHEARSELEESIV